MLIMGVRSHLCAYLEDFTYHVILTVSVLLEDMNITMLSKRPLAILYRRTIVSTSSYSSYLCKELLVNNLDVQTSISPNKGISLLYLLFHCCWDTGSDIS